MAVKNELWTGKRNDEVSVCIARDRNLHSHVADACNRFVVAIKAIDTWGDGILSRKIGVLCKLHRDVSVLASTGPRAIREELIILLVAEYSAASVGFTTADGKIFRSTGEVAFGGDEIYMHLNIVC